MFYIVVNHCLSNYFITFFIIIFYGIEKMNPIEIPKVLRTDEFLKRKYEICYGRNLPKKGRYFVKNVSTNFIV